MPQQSENKAGATPERGDDKKRAALAELRKASLFGGGNVGRCVEKKFLPKHWRKH